MPSHRNRFEKGQRHDRVRVVMIFLIPILFGTITFGVNLGNMLQSSQITRDAPYVRPSRGLFTYPEQEYCGQLSAGMGGMT